MSVLDTTYITFEQFLEDETIDPHSEWVDGRVVPTQAVSDRHDEVVIWTKSVLNGLVTERGLGRILGEPFVAKLQDDLPGRSPDVMFVTTDRLGLIRGNHLHGPPDLAVEVVSASSRTRDTLHKRGEYEQAGVREYWLIDPDARQASFLVLADGRLEPGPMQDGAFHSRVLPEAWIQPGWLFQTPMPKPLDVLRRWGVI